MQREPGRTAEELRIVRQRILRFGDADRHPAIAHAFRFIQRSGRLVGIGDAVRPVERFGKRFDFFAQGKRVFIQRPVCRRFFFDCPAERLRQCGAAGAAFGKHFAHFTGGAHLPAGLADGSQLFVAVGFKAVHCDDHRYAVALHIFDVRRQIRQPADERRGVRRLQIFFGDAAVILECADRNDQNDGIRLQAGQPALDIHEFLCAQIGAEAGLRDDIIRRFERQPGRTDGVAAVRNVGKRPAVDQAGRFFQRLHEVRLNRILQQHGHRPVGMEHLRRHRFAVRRIGGNDPPQPLFEILQVGRQTENRHDLAGDGDHEAVRPRNAVLGAAQADRHRAKRPVVHIENA